MKTLLIVLIAALTLAFGKLEASTKIKVIATGYDISDNLDLQAVSSIFGDCENLGEFERRLNDPENRLSNLDLNEDGYIDYLRVVELPRNDVHLITIQAVLGDNLYQDVANIEVTRKSKSKYRVYVVGNPYIYGNHYVIEPIYFHNPVLFSFFFSPRYTSWHSPYYWGYYPTFYTYRSPYDVIWYRNHIHVHINTHNHYKYHKKYDYHHHVYNTYSRNDYSKKHPEKSFENRNKGINNSYELSQTRRSSRPNTSEYRSIIGPSKQQESYTRRATTTETSKKYTVTPNQQARPTQSSNRVSTNEKTYKQPTQTKSANAYEKPVRNVEVQKEKTYERQRTESRSVDNIIPKTNNKAQNPIAEKTIKSTPQTRAVAKPSVNNEAKKELKSNDLKRENKTIANKEEIKRR